MNDISQQNRWTMAAHLAEISARAAREGNAVVALDVIEQARVLLTDRRVDPETDYREGLMMAGVPFGAIDAAVDSIVRGEQPTFSLPGQLAKLRAVVESEAGNRSGFPRAFAKGGIDAISQVQAWIGVKR